MLAFVYPLPYGPAGMSVVVVVVIQLDEKTKASVKRVNEINKNKEPYGQDGSDHGKCKQKHSLWCMWTQ